MLLSFGYSVTPAVEGLVMVISRRRGEETLTPLWLFSSLLLFSAGTPYAVGQATNSTDDLASDAVPTSKGRGYFVPVLTGAQKPRLGGGDVSVEGKGCGWGETALRRLSVCAWRHRYAT